ncbi:MAG: hypothetical protein ACYS8W_10340 [Planctomycetota bacterium]|jgi:hypothetical protein
MQYLHNIAEARKRLISMAAAAKVKSMIVGAIGIIVPVSGFMLATYLLWRRTEPAGESAETGLKIIIFICIGIGLVFFGIAAGIRSRGRRLIVKAGALDEITRMLGGEDGRARFLDKLSRLGKTSANMHYEEGRRRGGGIYSHARSIPEARFFAYRWVASLIDIEPSEPTAEERIDRIKRRRKRNE